MGVWITIIIVAAFLIVGGILIGYIVSRSEESSRHYKAERAYEAKVKKGIRQDHLKKKKKHQLK
jgi:hypothetical protein